MQVRTNSAEGSHGHVLEASRRYITLVSGTGEIVQGIISSKAMEVVAGDIAKFESRDGKVFVTSVEPASQSLFRSYRGVVKRMGANISRLFVITAIGETLNSFVIDRMLIAARASRIPATLVINKADLGLDQAAKTLEVYRHIGIPLVTCSAKKSEGLEPLIESLNQPELHVAALCGVSGVGKSTILNKLVPDAASRVGEVSERTGQGRQTTTQPRGYLYELEGSHRKILIDFPGVQFFGLSHVSPEELSCAFEEFNLYKTQCRFLNCRHLKEPECGVREALERGDIAKSRYASYLQIVQEIEDAREY